MFLPLLLHVYTSLHMHHSSPAASHLIIMPSAYKLCSHHDCAYACHPYVPHMFLIPLVFRMLLQADWTPALTVFTVHSHMPITCTLRMIGICYNLCLFCLFMASTFRESHAKSLGGGQGMWKF